jgi:hypothetical protein
MNTKNTNEKLPPPEIPEVAIKYYKIALEKIFEMLEEVKNHLYSEEVMKIGAAIVSIQTLLTAIVGKIEKAEIKKGEAQ